MKAIRFIQDLILWILLVLFGRNIKLAKSWNELTDSQLQEIAYSLEWYHKKKLEKKNTAIYLYSKLFLSLIKQLLRTNNAVKVWIALRQIPPEEYKSHVSFLTAEISRTKFPAAIKIKKKIFFSPGDRLQNISIKEFSFVDSLYYNWRKTNDNRFLNLLCATLYRTKNAISNQDEIDIRKPFNKIFVERDSPLWYDVPVKKKLAIAYAYEGSRNYIVQQYPHVFPKPVKEKVDENQVKKEVHYTPFGKLLHFKIQFDHSKLEATQNLNVHDFFGPYENELIELKKQKK